MKNSQKRCINYRKVLFFTSQTRNKVKIQNYITGYLPTLDSYRIREDSLIETFGDWMVNNIL